MVFINCAIYKQFFLYNLLYIKKKLKIQNHKMKNRTRHGV